MTSGPLKNRSGRDRLGDLVVVVEFARKLAEMFPQSRFQQIGGDDGPIIDIGGGLIEPDLPSGGRNSKILIGLPDHILAKGEVVSCGEAMVTSLTDYLQRLKKQPNK